MKIERISGKEERRVITGMIVDPLVLARIASKWEPNLFQSRWANIVAELCIKYHHKYSGAPKKAIEGLFESWASSSNDPDTINLVERFLSGLSAEYEELAKESNSSYLIDAAARHFTRVKLLKLAEQIQGHVEAGDVAKAAQLTNEFGAVEMGEGSTVHVLRDRAVLKKAFETRRHPIIELSGSIGKFFGDSLVREAFISFMGPEKRGKTWMLCEMAWRAMLQHRYVAFFSCGDESEEEMMLRFAVRASKTPLTPCVCRIPTAITVRTEEDEEHKGEGTTKIIVPKVPCEEVEFKKGLSYEKAEEAFTAVMRDKLKSKEEFLRLSVHPASTLSVKAMDAQLKLWEKEGWVPDVIIVDYMDILLESNPGDEMRHRINATWRDFRGLLQRWHALGITATQSDTASYEQTTMNRSNFSEDKRKNAHVTGMVGLNQTPDENEMEVMRLNWIVRRGARFTNSECCYLAGCLAIGNPAIRSCF